MKSGGGDDGEPNSFGSSRPNNVYRGIHQRDEDVNGECLLIDVVTRNGPPRSGRRSRSRPSNDLYV